MSALEEYLYSTEALAEEALRGEALVLVRFEASGSGTCGVTTAGEGLPLPVPKVDTAGDWRPLGACALPPLALLGATVGWSFVSGQCAVPFEVSGQASPAIRVALATTPLFALAEAGGAAVVTLPGAAVAARSDPDRHGDVAVSFPGLAARAFACALDNPVTNDAGSAAVVALLGQGDPELAALAASLAAGTTGHDAVAAALRDAVAGAVAYAAEEDGADVWSCALATYYAGSGDCEDGAILLHALLLAAGVPADRLVTAFGRVGIDRAGHAWVAYRRESDGAWTALDWTFGPGQGAVAAQPVLGEAAYYALVDYALTASAFFTVRAGAAAFFARVAAEAVTLPALGLSGEASLGARGEMDVASGFLSCLGACGARGGCRMAGATALATAGSAWGAAALGRLELLGLAAAGAGMPLPLPATSGLAGGGGQGRCRWPRLDAAAQARQRVVAAACPRLSRARGRGHALAGLLGRGVCALPDPGARGHGLDGRLAGAAVAAPLPDCLGCAAPLPVAEALVRAFALTARGGAAGPGADLEAYVFDPAAGEEWV